MSEMEHYWSRMTPEDRKFTLEALDKSIEKWERIADGGSDSIGSNNCALCKKFCHGKIHICQGCPVMEFSGESSCRRTPWVDVYELEFRNPQGSHRRGPAFLDAARRELTFLRSIRPTEPSMEQLVDDLIQDVGWSAWRLGQKDALAHFLTTPMETKNRLLAAIKAQQGGNK